MAWFRNSRNVRIAYLYGCFVNYALYQTAFCENNIARHMQMGLLGILTLSDPLHANVESAAIGDQHPDVCSLS